MYLNIKCASILLMFKVGILCSHMDILTMAYRLLNPLTFVGTLVNFWSNASDMLWAGSVEMMRTDSRTLDNCTAKLQL